MDFKALLGRATTLSVRRFTPSGAFLGDPANLAEDAPCLLLIGSEIPLGAQVGDELDVFVYLDSEDRPLATTRTPKLSLGEVAFLRVTSCTSFGAFVDWGLAKELLVPFKEQTRELHVGSREPIGVYLDDIGSPRRHDAHRRAARSRAQRISPRINGSRARPGATIRRSACSRSSSAAFWAWCRRPSRIV